LCHRKPKSVKFVMSASYNPPESLQKPSLVITVA